MRCISAVLALLALATLGLLGPADSGAAVLKVDIDRNGTVQSGFEAFSRSPDTQASGQSATYASALGITGNVQVVLTAASNLEFRNRGAVDANGLDALAQDFVFGNHNGTSYQDVTVTLNTLNSRAYRVTTYHHDQLSNILSPDPITVSDAYATGDIRATGFQETNGSGPVTIQRQTFEVYADGANPVSLSTVMINGFEIEELNPLGVTIGSANLDPVEGFREFVNSVDDPTSQTNQYIMQQADNSFSTVDVTLAATNVVGTDTPHLEFRDGRSGSVTGLRDSLVFVSGSGDNLDLTLGGLPSGFYEIATWHNDPNPALQNENTPFSLSVSDSWGTRTATGLQPVTTAQTTRFRSDGSTVTLTTNSNGRAMINGFDLVPLGITENLNVNIGLPGLDPEPDFQEFTASGTSGSVTRTFIMPLQETATFPDVSVTLSTDGTGLQFRKDRNSSGLLDSLVFVNTNGSDLILTLGGLPVGEFDITTFHFDPFPSLNPENTPFSITVEDALGIRTTSGLSPDELGEMTRLFSDGINDVVLKFNSNGRAMLNGFQLDFVPEPATVLVWSLLAGLGIGLGRRRRRA